MENWYDINSLDSIDTPALVIFAERVKQNIAQAIQMVKDPSCLRPHVKTNKIAEVCQLMLDAGITKFKCATIAEAEMLAGINAPDVLLAYQPVGPKANRLMELVEKYPATKFSCLVDNAVSAEMLSLLWERHHNALPVYIDVNVGMNRTGILPEHVMDLLPDILNLKGIKLAGLHAYDGHIHDKDFTLREEKAAKVYQQVIALVEKISNVYDQGLDIVIGGSPTFPVHSQQLNVECSPGTFVFWDWGYKNILEEQPFEIAALVITRVISVIDSKHVCVDLGHKSVAAENPLPRVHFLNAPEAWPLSQSEEHLVLRVDDVNAYPVGRVLYGVPIHICPTVALYEKAFVIENKKKTKEWRVIARDRYINT